MNTKKKKKTNPACLGCFAGLGWICDSWQAWWAARVSLTTGVWLKSARGGSHCLQSAETVNTLSQSSVTNMLRCWHKRKRPENPTVSGVASDKFTKLIPRWGEDATQNACQVPGRFNKIWERKEGFGKWPQLFCSLSQTLFYFSSGCRTSC